MINLDPVCHTTRLTQILRICSEKQNFCGRENIWDGISGPNRKSCSCNFSGIFITYFHFIINLGKKYMVTPIHIFDFFFNLLLVKIIRMKSKDEELPPHAVKLIKQANTISACYYIHQHTAQRTLVAFSRFFVTLLVEL